MIIDVYRDGTGGLYSTFPYVHKLYVHKQMFYVSSLNVAYFVTDDDASGWTLQTTNAEATCLGEQYDHDSLMLGSG